MMIMLYSILGLLLKYSVLKILLLNQLIIIQRFLPWQVHLQNASLAGGVAIGTIAPMIIQPWGAVLIGFVGGAVSTTGFKYIQVC